MATRRMTSLEITDTDAFLDMPVSSQLLYFHLNARADDDGFIAGPKRILRMVGCSEDDLKVLIGKKFIITFDDGVCVIKHWKISNQISRQKYKPTKYLNHKKALFIRGNGAYTLSEDGECMPVPDGHFSLSDVLVDKSSTNSRPRLGKVRLGKDSKEETENVSENVKDIFEYWNSKKTIIHKKLTPTLKSKIKTRLKALNVDEIKKGIDVYSDVLKSKDTWWTHKFTLLKFISQSNGVEEFYEKTIGDYKKAPTQFKKSYMNTEPKVDKEKIERDRQVAQRAAQTNPRIAEILKQKQQLTASKKI